MGLEVSPAVAVEQPDDPVARIIARLNDPLLNADLHAGKQQAYISVQRLLGQLAFYPHNLAAIRKLIRWLEFTPIPEFALPSEFADSLDARLSEKERRKWSSSPSEPYAPDPIRDYPAVQALRRMGPVVSQHLVDDYIATYLACDDPLVLKYHPRLHHIVTILTHGDKLAPAAVVYAMSKLTGEKNPRAVDAFRRCIKEIVGEFPEAQQPALFPPEALKL